MAWTLKKLEDFIDEGKEHVVSMACDEELLVVGVKGYGGLARVYDILTGELKFTMECNDSEECNQFSHNDEISVWLNSRHIFTWEQNNDSVRIWDREGNMILKDPHKDKEQHEEYERIMAMDEEERDAALAAKAEGLTEEEIFGLGLQFGAGIMPGDKSFFCMTVANGGKIYAGLEDGFLIMAEDDNNWKITEEIGWMDDKVKHIAVDGRWVAIQKGMAPIKLWDEEVQGFAENHKDLDLGCTEKMWLSYPLIFVAGRQGTRENRRDTFGVEIWNIQTGVMVRHILTEGDKQYRSMHSNGHLLTFCEEVHGWRDMEEWRKRENVEVAVFDLSQLKDENVKDEELWNFSTTFSVTDMEYEWVVAAISDKNLVVNHDKTKFSRFSIE